MSSKLFAGSNREAQAICNVKILEPEDVLQVQVSGFMFQILQRMPTRNDTRRLLAQPTTSSTAISTRYCETNEIEFICR